MARKQKTGCLYRPKYKDRHGAKQESSVWWAKWYFAGVPVRQSTGCTDYADAERWLLKKRAEAAEGRWQGIDSDRCRVSDLLALVRTDYEQRALRSGYEVGLRIDRYLEPAFGKTRAAEFSTILVKQYIAGRKRDGARPATINRELAILTRGFSLAAQQDPPLVARVPHIPKLEEANVREGIVTHQEYSALRASLAPWPHAQLALVISYHTGIRRGELLSLKWDWVDWNGNRIRVPEASAKTKKGRWLPIYGEMRAHLSMELERQQASTHGGKCDAIIQWRGKPISDFRTSWEKACCACGLEATLFHDLRRTAITNMIDAGISEKEAMEISGHRTRSMIDRYQIVSQRRLAAAGQKMEAFLNAMDPQPSSPQNTQRRPIQ